MPNLQTKMQVRDKQDHGWRLVYFLVHFQVVIQVSTPTDTAFNVVFIGELGVGKSSVIQRITGIPIRDINNGTATATTASTPYTAIISSKRYKIWDTPGLGGGNERGAPDRKAEKQLKKLLSDLMRLTALLESFYKTFALGICGGEMPVPAVVVITNLDNQAERDPWWSRNSPAFRKHGMLFCGHACLMSWYSGSTLTFHAYIKIISSGTLSRRGLTYVRQATGKLRCMGSGSDSEKGTAKSSRDETRQKGCRDITRR
ncbi:hypothetical protein BU15DRAFT_59163 [Melanogaster broomeanus]|nr:hypothetical protein BU15DRAFT_59163 [Melanogaster broomeanus]